MPFWTNEIKDLDKLYESFRGHLPEIVKEMEQLIKTEDPNVVMLYSRRCLEVIVTDLCETELKRPRKTEPLKGIIDKLNSEEKVPAHIITSMLSLNSMATYGAHPKDFDPEQVKPVLNNLAIIIRWYLKYKDFQVVSKSNPEEEKVISQNQPFTVKENPEPIKRKSFLGPGIILGGVILAFILFMVINGINKHPSYIPTDPNKVYFVDQRDNQMYSEVKIGNQAWMGENLKATEFIDGTPIPIVRDEKKWEKLQTPALCWYKNDKRTYGDTYGPLYNWFAVNTGKLCPVGWHVPSDAEWTALTGFLGDSIVFEEEVAGMKLKEAGNSHWLYLDTILSSNESGFTALPGGYRTIYGIFWGVNEQGSWWSSDEDDYNKGDAQNREIYYNDNSFTDIQQYKQFGMSVRCVKDKVISD